MKLSLMGQFLAGFIIPVTAGTIVILPKSSHYENNEINLKDAKRNGKGYGDKRVLGKLQK
ncbi:hypothetical protein [Mycoplasma parvum]|uniref:Uncharacterized protein n=1 Tax=Mycoplasma parvum str. Indiana TaxID=1403316 RepID=U5NG52_9MOLU|nr:hypothetical protein [Mycoplasma parvum]AGX89174.1 hypothetical protein PRV_02180 [Mycoplasma parvum str. Indiana]